MSHPPNPYALDRFQDGLVCGALLGRCARRKNVLAAGCGGVAIVNNHCDGVVAIEDGITDAARQPVVPETAVPHYSDRAPLGTGAERRGPGSSEAVAHDAVTHIKRRQRRKRMAADVGADM